MRITYDKKIDAAYIYLVSIPSGGVARSYTFDPVDSHSTFVLDFDNSGRLLGIEVLHASHHLPIEILGLSKQFFGSFRVALDKTKNIAYIYLTDKPKLGGTAHIYSTDPVAAQCNINVEFDAEARMIGMRISDADTVLPQEVLDQFRDRNEVRL